MRTVSGPRALETKALFALPMKMARKLDLRLSVQRLTNGLPIPWTTKLALYQSSAFKVPSTFLDSYFASNLRHREIGP
jgi:hypothetical protein